MKSPMADCRVAIDGVTIVDDRSPEWRLPIGLSTGDWASADLRLRLNRQPVLNRQSTLNRQSPIGGLPIVGRQSVDRRSSIVIPSIGSRHSPIGND